MYVYVCVWACTVEIKGQRVGLDLHRSLENQTQVTILKVCHFLLTLQSYNFVFQNDKSCTYLHFGNSNDFIGEK